MLLSLIGGLAFACLIMFYKIFVLGAEHAMRPEFKTGSEVREALSSETSNYDL
jgi:hypothetical protein